MKKDASKLFTGTFYIVGDKIAYTLDTSDEHALDHFELWSFVVDKLFPFLDAQTKHELKQDGVYGADRGRVVFKGERSPTGAYRTGTFSLYGTPGCKKHERQLKTIFGLNNSKFEIESDFSSDPHYKVQPQDKRFLDSVLSASKTQFAEMPALLRIAGWKKNPSSINAVQVEEVEENE